MRKTMIAALAALVSLNSAPMMAQDVLGKLGGIAKDQLGKVNIKPKRKASPASADTTPTRAAPPKNQGQGNQGQGNQSQTNADGGTGDTACQRTKPGAPVDIACILVGDWIGDVGSDPNGSSQSDVTVTIKRIGPKDVMVYADDERRTPFSVHLTRIDRDIMQTKGPGGILYEGSKSPPVLNVSWPDGAAWIGNRAKQSP